MVTPFVVPEVLGGMEPPPPQMPLSCQKRQMPLTVNGIFHANFTTWRQEGNTRDFLSQV